MIRKWEIEVILYFIHQQRRFGRDLRIIGFERPPKQKFDFLLYDRGSREIIEVEISRLFKFIGKHSSVKYEKIFWEKLCEPTKQLASGKYSFFKAEAEDVEKVIKDPNLSNQPLSLLSIIVEKGNAFPAFSENPESPEPGFSPDLCSFGLGPTYDVGEMAYKDVGRLLNKKSVQFSDKPGRSRVLVLVDRHPYLRPFNVNFALEKLILTEKVGNNIDRVFFILDKDNPRKSIDQNHEGLFTRIVDRIVQVYPSLN